jgi:hypothetical protein
VAVEIANRISTGRVKVVFDDVGDVVTVILQ